MTGGFRLWIYKEPEIKWIVLQAGENKRVLNIWAEDFSVVVGQTWKGFRPEFWVCVVDSEEWTE